MRIIKEELNLEKHYKVKSTLLASGVSIDEINVPIFMVVNLIVFVGFLLGFYFTLKQKTIMNSTAISQLETKLNEEIDNNKDSIREMKADHNQAYKQLDTKISLIEKEVSGISSGIAKIEGYMKAMAEKS